ncbi:outer membrane beta-barrel family protein [Chryseobacterium gregarium]|uniref:outer membrane beta-barrel family protein n=1 Tax=Chryseobacterium gregarium TaxID=456299 RepID=UPI00042071AA|nr:outer membrane beta-barrel family protein [Chryseobacterium gregarium]
MKKILLTLCFPIIAFAQQQKIEGKVTNEENQSIPQATIEIYDTNNVLIKNLLSNEQGIFTIEGIAGNQVKLIVYDLEYNDFEKQVDLLQPNQLIDIKLKKSAVSEIAEVAIVKKKPIIKRKIDRLEFNVQNSNISNLSAWAILKKTPGVVFSNNEFKIKGSSDILITINDKKVMVTGDELKTLLENTQGSDVRSVEVITNPPAKYEASGSAVLNFVMKENKLEGYRGYISGKYEQSIYPKGTGTIAQYYQNGKISAMAIYTRGSGAYYRAQNTYIYYPEDKTTWKGGFNRKDIDDQQNSLNTSIKYQADENTSIALEYRGFYDPKSYGIYDVPTNIYNAQNMLESYYNTINDHHSSTAKNNISLQADHQFGKSKLSFITYYISNTSKNYQNIFTALNFANQLPSSQTFINDSGQDVRLFSQQTDYNWKNEKWEVDAGAKYSVVKTNSILNFSDDDKGILTYKPEKSNVFDYRESNLAAYASLSLNLDKWSFKGGLRAENTDLSGTVSEPDENNSNQYLKLFPTAYVQYTTESKHQFGLTYGKRISRPNYSWLNPARSYFNLFSYFQGDPNLKATIRHNINFTYDYKGWSFEAFYRKKIDPSMELNFQIPETKMLEYRYTNIKKSSAYGSSIAKDFEIKPWWTLSASADLYHDENFFYGLDQQLYKKQIWVFNSSMSTNFTLDKASDWTLEFGNQYASPGIQGTFEYSGVWTAYLVMSRKFFNKKLEATLFFDDIFKTSKQKISTKYSDQNSSFSDYQDTQLFSLTLKYNFGNQSVKAAKSIKKSDEQSRL